MTDNLMKILMASWRTFLRDQISRLQAGGSRQMTVTLSKDPSSFQFITCDIFGVHNVMKGTACYRVLDEFRQLGFTIKMIWEDDQSSYREIEIALPTAGRAERGNEAAATTALLDAIPGAWERTQVGVADIEAGRVIPLDQLTEKRANGKSKRL
jgi:hypothetical protein